jgi:hypothetical protein
LPQLSAASDAATTASWTCLLFEDGLVFAASWLMSALRLLRFGQFVQSMCFWNQLFGK